MSKEETGKDVETFPFTKFVRDPQKIISDSTNDGGEISLVSPEGSINSSIRRSIGKKTMTPTSERRSKELDDLLSYAVGNTDKIKDIVRSCSLPIDDPMRPKYWKCLSNLLGKPFSHYELYMNGLKNVFGEEAVQQGIQSIKTSSLPSFADEKFHNPRYLNVMGLEAVHRVLAVISYERPDVTYCPVLQSLTTVLLHFLSEEDSYKCATAVLSQRAPMHFLTQTRRSYFVLSYVFHAISKKYCKTAWAFLKSKGEAQEDVFEDWVFWIFDSLPFYHLVRVIDCYLLEGPKILFRVGMALLDCYYKSLSESQRKATPCLRIQHYCMSLRMDPVLLLRIAFSYRDLSKSALRKLEVKAEHVTSTTKVSLYNRQMGSFEVINTVPAASRIMGRNEDLLDVVGEPWVRQRSHSQGSEYMFSFADMESGIVTRAQWKIIYNWLPTRIAVKRPRLLFTTTDDGCSFKTLYNKIESQEQTLIVVLTQFGDLIGSYISGKWLDRRVPGGVGNKYFGTGESFVFRLIPPPSEKFDWVGLTDAGAKAFGTASIPGTDTEERRRLRRANLFATGDDSTMVIGGGLKGQAIYIQEGMSYVTSGPSDTFTNPCLLSKQDTHPISAMEVFGFS